MFPQATTTYLQKVCSDHSPVLTLFLDSFRRRLACFKYDQRWIKRDGFTDAVNHSWRRQGSGQAGLLGKITQCRKDMSIWKRRAKPNSTLRIQEIHFKIDEATKVCYNNGEELNHLRAEINEEYRNEEIF